MKISTVVDCNRSETKEAAWDIGAWITGDNAELMVSTNGLDFALNIVPLDTDGNPIASQSHPIYISYSRSNGFAVTINGNRTALE